jgi:hypothetical protein
MIILAWALGVGNSTDTFATIIVALGAVAAIATAAVVVTLVVAKFVSH